MAQRQNSPSATLTKVAGNHYIKCREKPDEGGRPDVAISPDVVSFVHHRFGYCDLRRGGGIHNVAREAACLSLAAGPGACNVACCLDVPQMMEAPRPSPDRQSTRLNS